MKQLIVVILLTGLGVVGTARACLPGRIDSFTLEIEEVQVDGVVQEDTSPWEVSTRLSATPSTRPPDVVLIVEGVEYPYTLERFPFLRPSY